MQQPIQVHDFTACEITVLRYVGQKVSGQMGQQVHASCTYYSKLCT